MYNTKKLIADHTRKLEGQVVMAMEVMPYCMSTVLTKLIRMSQEMKDYCNTNSCRRATLLSHFASPALYTNPHECCDNCLDMCHCSICAVTECCIYSYRSTKAISDVYIKWVNTLLESGCSKPKEVISYYYSDADSQSIKDAREKLVADTKMRALLSTVGFGMGLTVENLKYVITWGFPADILYLWQEAGRCARDHRSFGEVHWLAALSEGKRSHDTKGFTKDTTTCYRKRIVEELYPLKFGTSFEGHTPAECTCTVCCSWQSCKMCMCCNVCRVHCKVNP